MQIEQSSIYMVLNYVCGINRGVIQTAIVQVDVNFSKPLTEEQIKELETFENMDDSEIDCSDIPEQTSEQLKRFVRISEILKGNFVNVSGEKLSRLEAERYLTHLKHLRQLSDSEYASLFAKLPPEDPRAPNS